MYEFCKDFVCIVSNMLGFNSLRYVCCMKVIDMKTRDNLQEKQNILHSMCMSYMYYMLLKRMEK